jgi:cytochrome c
MIAYRQHNGDKTMRKWMMIILAVSTTTTVARAQDAAAGQNSFTTCAICHAVGEGAQNKLGPILNGLDGRRSGSVAGYDYSAPLKNAGIAWSEATFKEFIANPAAKVPGTKMTFSFTRGDKDATDLWAYVKQFAPDGKIK